MVQGDPKTRIGTKKKGPAVLSVDRVRSKRCRSKLVILSKTAKGVQKVTLWVGHEPRLKGKNIRRLEKKKGVQGEKPFQRKSKRAGKNLFGEKTKRKSC